MATRQNPAPVAPVKRDAHGQSPSLGLIPATEAIKPPPTKREVLLAMAQALADYNQEQNDRRAEAIKKAETKLHARISRLAALELRKAPVKVESHWKSSSTATIWNVRKEIQFRGDQHPEVAALQEALRQAETAPKRQTDTEAIAKQLRQQQQGNSWANVQDRVAAILANKSARQALVQAGQKLLHAPSSGDISKAIDIGGAR